MDLQMPLSPEADGFIPPWAEWDFNEWETCTNTDLHGVRMPRIFCFNGVRVSNLNG